MTVPALPPRPEPPLPARLRAYVLNFTAGDTRIFDCSFVPGGKKDGVGIPSPLYCQSCGHSKMLHDWAASVAIVEANQNPLLSQRAEC